MSPVTLWLFFTLDRVIATFDSLKILSAIYLAIILIIAIITGFARGTDRSENFHASEYWGFFSGVLNRTRTFNILAIVLFSVGVCVKTFLPNTKEAVAIVVIPKIINYAKDNKEMMKIPDNVMKMANSFMEKKIKDWTESLDQPAAEDTSKIPIDSQINQIGTKLEELKKIKESALKVMK